MRPFLMKSLGQGLWLLFCWLTPQVAGAETLRGHIAAWHHRRPVAKSVVLPPFAPGKFFANKYVQIMPVPETVVADERTCFCYDVNDDRLALVHTYYYANSVITDYNALLKELRLPQLRNLQIVLRKDERLPTTATLLRRRPPKIRVTFPTPAVDPFAVAREIGRLIDQSVSPRHRGGWSPPEPGSSLRLEAEAAGVSEGTASILAALSLGMTGTQPLTADALDGPLVHDVDQFTRFPDLLLSRRQVLRLQLAAPRFATRFSALADADRQKLADPNLQEYLSQPDEGATAAAINQPLWQAAMRFGFKPTKVLYLKTLADLTQEHTTYQDLARSLISHAEAISPEWAKFLTEEYRRRGFDVPGPRFDQSLN